MDSVTCLKSLLLSIDAYRSSRGVQHAAQLQTSIEELSQLKSTGLLFSGHVLPSECLSALVELAGDNKTSASLSGSIITLLAQLALDEEARALLHSSYNLSGTLASIIHNNSATPGEPVVLQCLQLLQRLTYNLHISPCSTYLDELLNFLVQHIRSPNDELTLPCLGLMANLCRCTPSVHTHIKSLSQVKAFYRTLINFLAHNSLTVVVFALSILASLTLGEEVGEKLFHSKNIHQTFQLIFNIIVNGDGTLTRKYAVDLLVDLLKNPKIADYLSRYEHLSVCLTQVLGLLHSKDPDSAAKVLELLLSICSVSGLRSSLCQAVFVSSTPRLRLGPRKETPSGGAEPALALLHWVSMQTVETDCCCLQAVELLVELVEEALGSTLSPNLQSYLELLVPALLSHLQPPEAPGTDTLSRRHRAVRSVNLLMLLCRDDPSRMVVSQQLSAALCLARVEQLFSTCLSTPPTDSQLSQAGFELVVKLLDLMSHMKQLVRDMETSFYRVLQDQRLIRPLAHSLTSDSRENVHTALRVLFEAAPLPDFSPLALGESIAANNAYRQREAELSVGRVELRPHFSLGRGHLPPDVSPATAPQDTMQCLIEKLQNGMEIQDNVRAVRVSEIMDVYEQKISALAAKEGRLQDLLEAKAQALMQADRLITQYRCQRAQAEAEARKIASLLKEAERDKEDLQAQLAGHSLEAEKARQDIQQLLQHNTRLQTDSHEHQLLKASYNQLLHRSKDTDRTLKELQVLHTSLTKQAENLKKQNEVVKLQHDRVVALLAEKEEQLKAVEANLKEKMREVSALQCEVQNQQQCVTEREKEKEDMAETIDMLRKELNKTELARKDASIRASSLELQKSQLEVKLQKKEDELNKHSQMIAMIHSLSSGKLKNDNLSL